jgi:hypothetical protein
MADYFSDHAMAKAVGNVFGLLNEGVFLLPARTRMLGLR